MTLRVARPPLDPEARRLAAEDRVRTVCGMLADAIVDLAATMPPATHPVELVAVDAAAKRLGIARSTLYQIIGTGAIRSVQVGGRRFVPSSEIEAVAEGRQNGPASQRGRPKAGKGGPHA